MGAYICGGVGTVLAIAKNKQEKPEDSDLARVFFPAALNSRGYAISTEKWNLYQLCEEWKKKKAWKMENPPQRRWRWQ